MDIISYLIVAFAVSFLIWTIWNYFRVRKAAQFVENTEFKNLLRQGQLIDLRSPAEFGRKHILGARNFALAQFKESLSALRKDKPVLLYDSRRGQAVARAVLILKKAGYQDIYVLRDGFEYWDGKVK